jgi:hypothetical protein
MNAMLVFHVAISLVGILSGLVVALDILQRKPLATWNTVFLTTTVLTSLTGYLLPATTILPSHIVGAVSLVVLGVAIVALYSKRLAGFWRSMYVITAMTALYLNLFVFVVQAFLKIEALHALAPTQSEPPFVLAQGALFLLFLIVTGISVVRFRDRLAI